jgi:hypothetical protein
VLIQNNSVALFFLSTVKHAGAMHNNYECALFLPPGSKMARPVSPTTDEAPARFPVAVNVGGSRCPFGQHGFDPELYKIAKKLPCPAVATMVANGDFPAEDYKWDASKTSFSLSLESFRQNIKPLGVPEWMIHAILNLGY